MANESSIVRVYNKDGNVQPFQMVLYKKSKKMIYSNKVVSGNSVHEGVHPNINIGDTQTINGIEAGD